jgi:hypothetical protein
MDRGGPPLEKAENNEGLHHDNQVHVGQPWAGREEGEGGSPCIRHEEESPPPIKSVRTTRKKKPAKPSASSSEKAENAEMEGFQRKTNVT